MSNRKAYNALKKAGLPPVDHFYYEYHGPRGKGSGLTAWEDAKGHQMAVVKGVKNNLIVRAASGGRYYDLWLRPDEEMKNLHFLGTLMLPFTPVDSARYADTHTFYDESYANRTTVKYRNVVVLSPGELRPYEPLLRLRTFIQDRTKFEDLKMCHPGEVYTHGGGAMVICGQMSGQLNGHKQYHGWRRAVMQATYIIPQIVDDLTRKYAMRTALHKMLTPPEGYKSVFFSDDFYAGNYAPVTRIKEVAAAMKNGRAMLILHSGDGKHMEFHEIKTNDLGV